MRKLTLLSSAFLMGLVLLASPLGAQTYKFKSTPHLPFSSSQTVIDQIYVPTNVQMTDIRIGVHINSVLYSSLRLVLTVPTGQQIELKAAQAVGTNWFGSLGSARSYAMFRDGGKALTGPVLGVGQSNDETYAPAVPLATVNGRASAGWWTLTVQDNRTTALPYQEGVLKGWVVMFNSVVVEQEVPIWTETRTGNNLVGIWNGQQRTIPNQAGGGEKCTGGNDTDPSVNPGINGDAYKFEINQTTYPGHVVGTNVPGFSTPGRFRVSVIVSTSTPPPPQLPTGGTTDVAVYFGKTSTYTPPVKNPPFPPNATGQAATGWPNSLAGTSATLLPAGGTPIYGGVRLIGCQDNDSPGWNAKGNLGVLDVTFDDLALTSINDAGHCDPNDPAFSGVCGTYRPERQLSLFNGLQLNGLYYVTIYDTFGENMPGFGHMRVLSITVTYLAGGGQVANALLHQGIAGPLMGVAVPGAIAGGPAFGYLADVVAPIPPYSINAKEQDPLLVFWTTQKMYPRPATGYERMQAINVANNNAPPAGVVYDGPFAYASSLDANPQVAGSQVNLDLINIPTGTYRLRTNLVQARYDDDPSDNEFESMPVQITPATLAYYGQRFLDLNPYQGGSSLGQYSMLFQMSATGANGSTFGTSFTLFKFPSTRVTSVDYYFDRGYYANNFIRSNFRISVWRVANGYFGAPVGPPVAMSPTMLSDEYMPDNWRTFPIYACDQAGVITNQPANLAPGTYAVMLDNMGSASPLIFPYTYAMIPALEYRHREFLFSERFGPIGPFTTHGTRLHYMSTVSPLLTPPTGTLSGGAVNASPFGNATLPMRLNMVTQNDFAINYVAIAGSKGTESVSISQAPLTLRVNVLGASDQNGQTRDFNVRVEIFNGNQRVYLSDVLYGPANSNIIPSVPGVAPYQTVNVPMADWTPTTGGIYRVRVSFSRNPNDQNPANDVHEFNLYVSGSRAIVVRGANASEADVNAAIDVLKSKSIDYEVVSINDAKLAQVSKSDIILTGDVTVADQSLVSNLLSNGNEIAILYSRDRNFGSLLRNVDNAFGIQRATTPDYNNLEFGMRAPETPAVESPVQVSPELLNLKIESKEDIVKIMKSASLAIEPVENANTVITPASPVKPVETFVPAVISSPYGDMDYLDEDFGSYALLRAFPAQRTPQQQVQDVKVAAGFELGSNYPNPFNPSTVISYTLPEQSLVTLRVLDMLGREVMTLVNESQNAGTFNVSWKGLDMNGVSVASGQYIYRIEATPVNGGQPFISMKKMTLAK